MSFNWKAIQSYEDPEVALYRLLGEMLRRRARASDLEQIRAFLLGSNLNSDGWLSIGEALHRTTSGAPAGHEIWVAWLETFDDVDVDVERLGMMWVDFGEDLSEASESVDLDADPPVHDLQIPTAAMTIDDVPSIADDDDDTDSTSLTSSLPVLRTGLNPNTGMLGESPTQLLRMVPQGPFSLRLFGIEYRQVDEYTVLTLVKRGLFLAAEVRFGDQWLPAWNHPAFSKLAQRMQAEAVRILTRDHGGDEPTTAPGAL